MPGDVLAGISHKEKNRKKENRKRERIREKKMQIAQLPSLSGWLLEKGQWEKLSSMPNKARQNILAVSFFAWCTNPIFWYLIDLSRRRAIARPAPTEVLGKTLPSPIHWAEAVMHHRCSAGSELRWRLPDSEPKDYKDQKRHLHFLLFVPGSEPEVVTWIKISLQCVNKKDVFNKTKILYSSVITYFRAKFQKVLGCSW